MQQNRNAPAAPSPLLQENNDININISGGAFYGDDPDTQLNGIQLRGGGWWTPAEERRLCLIVRALLPAISRQSGSVSSRATSVGVIDRPHPLGRKRKRFEASPFLDELETAKGTIRVDPFREIEWSEVSRLMLNARSENQCQEKWYEGLDPAVNRSLRWSTEEDQQLLKGKYMRVVANQPWSWCFLMEQTMTATAITQNTNHNTEVLPSTNSQKKTK